MAYDQSLDAQVFSMYWENETGKIVISVHSYNSGPKKMQIVRELKNKDDSFTFAKLGRLTKEEIEGILPIIQEASAVM